MNQFQLNLHLIRIINFFNAASKLFSVVQTVFFLMIGLDLFQIGVLLSIVWGSSLLLELPSGILADLLGRKLSLLISNLCLFFAFLIYITFSSFWLFVIASILYGGHKAFRSGADSAITFESLKKLKRSNEFKGLWGKYFSENRLAFVITGTFVGFLAAISFTYVLIVSLLFSAICMVASVLLTETGTRQKKKFNKHFSDVFRLVWTNKKLFYTIMYFGLLGGFAEAIFKFNQAYYQLVGLPLAFFGIIFAAGNVAGFFTARYSVNIEKKIGGRKSILILPILICLSYLFLGIYASLISLLVFVFEDGLYSLRWTVGAHEINRFTKKANRSTVVSVYGLVASVFTSAMSLVFGFVSNYGITTIYLASGSILAILISYPTYYLMKK